MLNPIVQQPKRMLVICDRPDLIQAVKSALKPALPQLIPTYLKTGLQGFHMLYQERFDMVIIDDQLQDLNGRQLAQALKHDPAFSQVPIILMVEANNLNYGRYTELYTVADAILVKNDIPETLLPTINRLLVVFAGVASQDGHKNFLPLKHLHPALPVNRLLQQLDQSAIEIALMKQFNALSERVGQRNVMLHLLFQLLETVLDYDLAGIFFNDAQREPRIIYYHASSPVQIEPEHLTQWTQKIFKAISKNTHEPWLFKEHTFETLFPESHEPPPVYTLKHMSMFTFQMDKTLTGALVFLNRQAVDYQLIFPFKLVDQQLATLMRIRRYYTEGELKSIIDPLTQVYTQQHWLWTVGREIRQSKRHQTPFTIAMLSVENLSALNHLHGIEAGDQALKQVAQMALSQLRSVDVVCRYGGGKFAILLNNTDADQASKPLKRLQRIIHQTPLSLGDVNAALDTRLCTRAWTPEIASTSDLMRQVQQDLEKARQTGQTYAKL